MPLTQHNFDKYLASIKTIVAAGAIKLPSCFISYAWEADKSQNEKLQTWLKKLKQDLETVGIETFLDIAQMNGDMRECMQENIRKSDYVLLIGTERFKARIEEDRLYKTSRDSFNAYKKFFATSTEICIQIYKSFGQGNAVVLIEEQGTNFIAFIENGKVLLEIPIPQEMQSEFSRIRWLPKDSLGIYVAELSKAVYEIIDQAKKEVNFKLSAKPIGNSVTNVAFEFGFALEKKEQRPDAIIPLLYSGDFRTSFPDKIFDILIRDMRGSNDYYDLLIGLNNPLGIIPAMCTELARSEEYKALLNSQSPDKPEVKFGRRGGEGVMHNANINSQGLVTLDLSISATELTTEQELGRGGYGVVYLGKRKHNPVAIKQLITGRVSERILSEFNKEAIIMAQLGAQCPQLVRLFGICFEEPYRLIMELLTRGSLYSLLRNDRTLDWTLKSNIARDVAIGLEFLHDRNVIHRDIKSLNILLSGDFSAKLSDYGLAKIKENSTSSTSVAQAVGTLPWMAPELIAGDEPLYSIYSDIYSYGLVLLEMATHKMPFEGVKSSGSLINKIINGIAEPIPPTTPLHFVELINKCQDKLPENRPNTASIIQLLNQQKELKPVNPVLFPDEFQISSIGYSGSGSSQVKPGKGSSIPISYGMLPPKTDSIESASTLREKEEEIVKLKAELEKMKLSNSPEHRKQSATTSPAAKPKSVAISIVSPQEVSQFLHHVGYGEQAEAEAMLQKDRNLALAYGDLTDCSVDPKTYTARTWKNITAFQYAILALDYQMWTMIQKYINTENARQQAEEITNRATLKDKKGWIIKQGDIDWPQTGWLPLTTALDVYVKGYDLWSYEECITNWCQQVGGAQLILPAHIINEYSHTSRSFYLCPKWQGEGEPVLPRIGVADWINNNGYKLGSDFAWIRTELNRRAKIGKNNFTGNKYCKWRVTGAGLWWDDSRNEAYVWTFQQEDGAVPRDLAACMELLTSRTEQARDLVLKLTSGSRPASRQKCLVPITTISSELDSTERTYGLKEEEAEVTRLIEELERIDSSIDFPQEHYCERVYSQAPTQEEIEKEDISNEEKYHRNILQKEEDSGYLIILNKFKSEHKILLQRRMTPEEQLAKFFKHVGYGEQNEAEDMLKVNNKLSLIYGDLTDCSLEPKTYKPRTWKNITAFQYSILVLDYHMWTMIKKYMTTDAICEQKEKLTSKAKLTEQEGWIINSYNYDWPQTGWSSLIKSLGRYLENYDLWNKTDDWNKQRQFWYEQVGGSQLMLPAHVINEYMHPYRSWHSCPIWDGEGEEPLPRTGVNIWTKEDPENHWNAERLGRNLAWVRWDGVDDNSRKIGCTRWNGLTNRWWPVSIAEQDLTACVELLKARTKQAQSLIYDLKEYSKPKQISQKIGGKQPFL